MIQEKVQLCYNIEHLKQGKNRTGEHWEGKETLRGKGSKQLELSVAFDICPLY